MEKIKKKYGVIVGIYLIVALALVGVFVSINSPLVSSGVGLNSTVYMTLEVGAVFPEILNMSLNEGNAIVLTANSTTSVLCQAVLEDWNNDTTIFKVNATLFDDTFTGTSPDDNNSHYSNSSCVIDLDASSYLGGSIIDDQYLAVANCTFDVLYNANPTGWNCSVYVEDVTNRSNTDMEPGTILGLLALGLPDSIDYGIVNSTEVSTEQTILVENVGNVQFNITVNGYANASEKDDGKAMNCSHGSIDYISVEYEKFNLTATTPGVLGLSSFEASYTNLTSSLNPAIRTFELNYRQSEASNEAVKDSYWRIYVPKGVAGTCEGNIEFGATVAVGS